MSRQLDDPSRHVELRTRLEKPALRHWYRRVYRQYADSLSRAIPSGEALEIGTGTGFAKEVIPELITSDVLPYPGIDLVLDARQLPLPAASLRFIGMLNVFHHIADAEAFLREAERCLAPGGRLLVVDQHPGIISTPILRFLHHEPFDMQAPGWAFRSTGPLSGANGALAWMVFQRDRQRLARLIPGLSLIRYETLFPLFYWLAGGLKPWSLVPAKAIGAVDALDTLLLRLSPAFGSFVAVELERQR